MRLYHFLSCEFALSDLALRRLKISRLGDLNDPFEFFAAELSDKDLRRAVPELKSEMHSKIGLLCFSKNWSNPVLWSHYGDKHRGMCLGFDVPDGDVKAIDYSADRLVVEFENDDETRVSFETTQRLIYTKFKDWAYEEEVRVYLSLDPAEEQGGLYFFDFGEKLDLREVILGPRCGLPIERVRALANQYGSGVAVIKSRLAFKSYSVVPVQFQGHHT